MVGVVTVDVKVAVDICVVVIVVGELADDDSVAVVVRTVVVTSI